MGRIIYAVFAALALSGLPWTGFAEEKEPVGIVMSIGRRINTLDPAQAADTTSQSVICAFYETLLQYKYKQGTYQLEPGLLASMPEISKDGTEFHCTLRSGLRFSDGSPLTSADVKFSFLRLADERIHSPGFWVVRDSLCGTAQFREKTAAAEENDYSMYQEACDGFRIIDNTRFVIRLKANNPRFIYMLALPYTAVVNSKAARQQRNFFAGQPAGSGPFIAAKWEKDYVLVMKKNPLYRIERDAGGVRLPYADEIICYLVKQPLASWLMFLQGELDYYALDSDNFEAVVRKNKLSSALTDRGIRLISAPCLETNYIGFSFTDPLLGKNTDLRRAITLCFDRTMRIEHSGGRFTEAYGPVPPGVPGNLGPHPEFGHKNIEKAREYMKKAGFPDGIDPKTGKHLVIAFDQTGSDTFFRQTAELFAGDLRRIGIEMKANFNNRPRFLQKLSTGEMQMFRLSWTGDYPDAENFLQLFYGPNAGSANRAACHFPEFDRMYREILQEKDPVVLQKKYREMAQFVQEQCPWIFESHTMSFILAHQWLQNYIPHDFAFGRWKYLNADPVMRKTMKQNFKPLSFKQLRSEK